MGKAAAAGAAPDGSRRRSLGVRTPPPSPRGRYGGQQATRPATTPARLRVGVGGGGGGGGGSGGFNAPSPGPGAPSPSRARAAGRADAWKPPLSPKKRTTFTAAWGAEGRGGGGGGGRKAVAAVSSGEQQKAGRVGGDWTREELEGWAGQEVAPATPVVAVLGAGRGGGEVDDGEAGVRGGGGGEGAERRSGGRVEMRGGGVDAPVVTRVLPPGLEVRGIEYCTSWSGQD